MSIHDIGGLQLSHCQRLNQKKSVALLSVHAAHLAESFGRAGTECQSFHADFFSAIDFV